MSKVIVAEVLTNSVEDENFKVRIKSEDFWMESDLLPTPIGQPLNKGDLVYVDLAEGVEEPVIIGRVKNNKSVTKATVKGQQIWECHSGDGWSVATVNGNTLTIEDSSSNKIVVDGNKISISNGKTYIDIEGNNIRFGGSTANLVKFQGFSSLLTNVCNIIATVASTPVPSVGTPLNAAAAAAAQSYINSIEECVASNLTTT